MAGGTPCNKANIAANTITNSFSVKVEFFLFSFFFYICQSPKIISLNTVAEIVMQIFILFKMWSCIHCCLKFVQRLFLPHNALNC